MADHRGALMPLQGPGFTSSICGETVDPPFEYGAGNWWILITEDQFGLYASDPETDEAAALIDVRERAGSELHPVMPVKLCLDCGHDVVRWKTSDELWARVMLGDLDRHICPTCFIERSHEQGIFPAAWVLSNQEIGADE